MIKSIRNEMPIETASREFEYAFDYRAIGIAADAGHRVTVYEPIWDIIAIQGHDVRTIVNHARIR